MKCSKLFFLFYFVVSLAILTLYFLSFYPGILTADSLDQWSQMHNFVFSDIHPVFHTLIIYLITRIWANPAAVVIFQVLYFSFALAIVFSYFKSRGLSSILLIILLVLVTINPISGTMVVTIWKDVLYTINLLILGFCLLLLTDIGTKNFFKSKLLIILFGLSLLFLAMLRQNGMFSFLLLFLVLPIIFKDGWRKILLEFLIISVLIFLIKGPFYQKLSVSPSPAYQYYYQPIYFLSNVVKNKIDISERNRQVIDNLLDYDLWDKYYNPYSSWNYFVSDEFDKNYLVNNQRDVLETAFSVALNHPLLFVKSWLQIDSYLFFISKPKNPYSTPVALDMTQSSDEYYSALQNKYGIHPNFILPQVRDKIVFYVMRINASKYLFIFFQAASYLYLNFTIFIYLIWKKKKRFIVIVPVLSNTISMAIVSGSQELRYAYPTIIFSVVSLLVLAEEIKLFSFRRIFTKIIR